MRASCSCDVAQQVRRMTRHQFERCCRGRLLSLPQDDDVSAELQDAGINRPPAAAAEQPPDGGAGAGVGAAAAAAGAAGAHAQQQRQQLGVAAAAQQDAAPVPALPPAPPPQPGWPGAWQEGAAPGSSSGSGSSLGGLLGGVSGGFPAPDLPPLELAPPDVLPGAPWPAAEPRLPDSRGASHLDVLGRRPGLMPPALPQQVREH